LNIKPCIGQITTTKPGNILVLLLVLGSQYFFNIQYELPSSCNLTYTWFDIQYFIPNLLIASLSGLFCSTFVLKKVWRHAETNQESWDLVGSHSENINIKSDQASLLELFLS
jgi:hypothetical protein